MLSFMFVFTFYDSPFLDFVRYFPTQNRSKMRSITLASTSVPVMELR